jgi:hypothetical protein
LGNRFGEDGVLRSAQAKKLSSALLKKHKLCIVVMHRIPAMLEARQEYHSLRPALGNTGEPV